MKSDISVDFPTVRECLGQSIKIGLGKKWKHQSKEFPASVKGRGVYVLYTKTPKEILYVGKTAGKTMHFAKRLYRHASKSASGNSKVHRKLKGMRKCIFVGLIDVEQIKTFFSGERLNDSGYIDIFEQIAIHLLRPKLQRNKQW